MKIDSLNILNKDTKAASDAKNREGLPKNVPVETAAEENKGDTVSLSGRSRMIARASELATQAPDIRQDKVNDIKARLAAGTYNVDSKVVAEAMLRKSVTEV